MKDLHVYCLHNSCKNVDALRKELHFDEREYDLNFVWDNDRPDYLIITEQIYISQDYLNSFIALMKHKPIVINYPREFHTPDLNFSDYAIVWDRYLSDRDRISRIPTMLYYERQNSKNKYSLSSKEDIRNIIRKRKFCNFIYSNGNAYPYRDLLFYALSEYKRVDSYGRHLNNMGNIPDRFSDDWMKNAIKTKADYLFSITCNNHWYYGGIDEKLLTTFLAHSIPIFWGDPSVNIEFNEKAFVNCHNFQSVEAVVEEVKRLNEDEDALVEMLMQPWQTEEQLTYQTQKIHEYHSFLCNIFSQHKDDARRAGEGTWRDYYLSLIAKSSIPNKRNRIKLFIEALIR